MELHPPSINEFNIPSNAIIVFTSGRANIYKRIDFIIEFANILINKRKLNNIYFLYCGDGPNMRDLKALCDNYHLNDKFIFAGIRNDVSSLRRNATLAFRLPGLKIARSRYLNT